MSNPSSSDTADEQAKPDVEDVIIVTDPSAARAVAPDPVLEIVDESPRPGPAPHATLPPAPVATPPRRGSIFPALAGGVIAAGLGFGVAQVVPDGWPMGGTAQVEAALARQAQEIARLSSALAEFPTAAPPPDLAPLTAEIAALADRLAATESTVAALPPPPEVPADPTPRIEALSARIAALEALPPGTVIEGNAGGDPAALAALQTEIAALQADLAGQAEASKAAAETAAAAVAAAASDAKAALEAAKAEAAQLQAATAGAATAAATAAALGRVQAALETGAPFVSAVEALAAAGAAVPPVLADNAAAGLPTLASLQASFPAAARAGLDASLRADMGETTAERFGSFLRTQTGARSLEPREGTDPDAVLSRAEAALREGQLPAAIAEIAALPDPGQAALADWVAQATRRIDASAAVQALAGAVDAAQGGG